MASRRGATPATPVSQRPPATPLADTPRSESIANFSAEELLTSALAKIQEERRRFKDQIAELEEKEKQLKENLSSETESTKELRNLHFDKIAKREADQELKARQNAWANLDLATQNGITNICAKLPQPDQQQHCIALALFENKRNGNRLFNPPQAKNAAERPYAPLVLPVFVFDPDKEMKAFEKEVFLKKRPCAKCDGKQTFCVATAASSFIITCFRSYRCSRESCRAPRPMRNILADLADIHPHIRSRWHQAASTERNATCLMEDSLRFYEGMLASSSNITQACQIHQDMLTNTIRRAEAEVLATLKASHQPNQAFASLMTLGGATPASGAARVAMNSEARDKAKALGEAAAQLMTRVNTFLNAHSMKSNVIRELITANVESKLGHFVRWAETRGISPFRANPRDNEAFRIVLSADHTFKLAKSVRVNGKTRPFSAVFTVMNDDQEVVLQKFVHDQSFASIQKCVQTLDARLKKQDPSLGDPTGAAIPFYIDNCCQFRRLILESMPSVGRRVTIKLDLFHWIRRWTRKVKLNTPEGVFMMSRIREITRNGKANVIRLPSVLMPEFEQLRLTDEWQAIARRNKQWERVWANQMKHLVCLADPAGRYLAARGTQESYHASVNDHVLARTTGGPEFVAATLFMFNWSLTLKAQMKVQGRTNAGINDPQFLDDYCELIRSIEWQCQQAGAPVDPLSQLANGLLLAPRVDDHLKELMKEAKLSTSFGLAEKSAECIPDPAVAGVLRVAVGGLGLSLTTVSSSWLASLATDGLRALIAPSVPDRDGTCSAFLREISALLHPSALSTFSAHGMRFEDYMESSPLAPSLVEFDENSDLRARELLATSDRMAESTPIAVLLAHAAVHSPMYFSEDCPQVQFSNEPPIKKAEAILMAAKGEATHRASSFGAIFGLLRATSLLADAAIVLFARGKNGKTNAFLFVPYGDIESLHFLMWISDGIIAPLRPSDALNDAFQNATEADVAADVDETPAAPGQPARPQPPARNELQPPAPHSAAHSHTPAADSTGKACVGAPRCDSQHSLFLWCLGVALFWHFRQGQSGPLGQVNLGNLAAALFNCFATGPPGSCGSLVHVLDESVIRKGVPMIEVQQGLANYLKNFGRTARTERFAREKKLPAMVLFRDGAPFDPAAFLEWFIPIYDVAKSTPKDTSRIRSYVSTYGPNVKACATTINYSVDPGTFAVLKPEHCKTPRAAEVAMGGTLDRGHHITAQTTGHEAALQMAAAAAADDGDEQLADEAPNDEHPADGADDDAALADEAPNDVLPATLAGSV